MSLKAKFSKAIFGAAMCLFTPAASASVSDRIVLEMKPTAKFQVVEQGEGFQTLLVVTNAPFDVSVEGMIGAVNVDLMTTGQINGHQFGTLAQSPGIQESTVNVSTAFETVIYESDRATAAGSGSLRQQAVKLTVTYDPLANPAISIEPQE